MSMPTTSAPKSDDELLARVLSKRADVDRYLRVAERRRRLLVNLTIVAGSIAAALTAAPALGGQPLAEWITETLSLTTPSWRILCALACVCSLVATVSTQMRAAHGLENHITKAQTVRATLESLEVSIASGTVSRRQAAAQFRACIEGSAFIDTTQ